MRSNTLFIVAVGMLLFATTQHAAAQPIGPVGPTVRNPVMSPYLNLLRRETPAAINYFGLVRPQIAGQAALQSLQQQLGSMQQSTVTSTSDFSALPVTGQAAWYLNTGGYFMNNSVGNMGNPLGQMNAFGQNNRNQSMNMNRTPTRSPSRGGR